HSTVGAEISATARVTGVSGAGVGSPTRQVSIRVTAGDGRAKAEVSAGTAARVAAGSSRKAVSAASVTRDGGVMVGLRSASDPDLGRSGQGAAAGCLLSIMARAVPEKRGPRNARRRPHVRLAQRHRRLRFSRLLVAVPTRSVAGVPHPG